MDEKRLEERAQHLQERVNRRLAELSPLADSGELIEEELRGEWDWLDVTTIGGPRQIMITRKRG